MCDATVAGRSAVTQRPARPPPPPQILRTLYRRAMELEVAFFSGQPGAPAPRGWRRAPWARHGGRAVCAPLPPRCDGDWRRTAASPRAAPAAPAPLQAASGCWCVTFDDTCSEKDTIGTLLAAAVDAAVQVRG